MREAKLIRFRVQNYKLLEDVTLEVDPHVTVIVGRNDAGKTMLLEALRQYGEVQRGEDALREMHQLLGGASDPARSPRFEAVWEVEGKTWTHTLHAHLRQPEEWLSDGERDWTWLPREGRLIVGKVGERPHDYDTRLKGVFRTLMSMGSVDWEAGSTVPADVYTPLFVTFRFMTPTPHLLEVSSLQLPGRQGEMPYTDRRGYGWVDYLQSVVNRRDGSMEELEKLVKGQFPFFGGCKIHEERIPLGETVSPRMIRPSAIFQRWLLVRVKQADGAEGANPEKELWLLPSEISAGVLFVMAFFAIIFADLSGRIVAFEEPENGLNPAILLKVMEAMLSVTKQRGKQLLITTHHAWWLDVVEPKSVRVITRDEKGVRLRGLDLEAWGPSLGTKDVFLSEVFQFMGPEGLLRAPGEVAKEGGEHV